MKYNLDALSREQLEQTILRAFDELRHLRQCAMQEARYTSLMQGLLFGAAVASAAFFAGVLVD